MTIGALEQIVERTIGVQGRVRLVSQQRVLSSGTLTEASIVSGQVLTDFELVQAVRASFLDGFGLFHPDGTRRYPRYPNKPLYDIDGMTLLSWVESKRRQGEAWEDAWYRCSIASKKPPKQAGRKETPSPWPVTPQLSAEEEVLIEAYPQAPAELSQRWQTVVVDHLAREGGYQERTPAASQAEINQGSWESACQLALPVHQCSAPAKKYTLPPGSGYDPQEDTSRPSRNGSGRIASGWGKFILR